MDILSVKNLPDLEFYPQSSRKTAASRRASESSQQSGPQHWPAVSAQGSAEGSSRLDVTLSATNTATVGTNGACEHHQPMIEKIVKLQRMLARRNDKIDFLEEHVRQLLAEMQRKSKIIQSYAMREDISLVPEANDLVKKKHLPYAKRLQAQLASRPGGTIMGSVFGGHAMADPSMTLQLSLQINSKLQTVLEDVLLKNITLKDNIETLGDEISQLSRENRALKSKLTTTST